MRPCPPSPRRMSQASLPFPGIFEGLSLLSEPTYSTVVFLCVIRGVCQCPPACKTKDGEFCGMEIKGIP